MTTSARTVATAAPQSVDAYIDAAPEEKRARLRLLRSLITRAVPEAAERISWGMPTYAVGRHTIHFACAKAHVGLYPGPDAVETFARRLDALGLAHSKGAIRLPDDLPVPESLVTDLATWCLRDAAVSPDAPDARDVSATA